MPPTHEPITYLNDLNRCMNEVFKYCLLFLMAPSRGLRGAKPGSRPRSGRGCGRGRGLAEAAAKAGAKAKAGGEAPGNRAEPEPGAGQGTGRGRGRGARDSAPGCARVWITGILYGLNLHERKHFGVDG